MSQIRKVLKYILEEELSQAKTSKVLGISRYTVAEYVKRAKAANLTWPLDDSLSDKDLEELLFPKTEMKRGLPQPDWDWVHKQMKRRGATLMDLHREYLEEHPNGLKYRRFCQLYKQYKKTLPASMRQTHVAGEKIFVDYAGHTIPVVVPETGNERHAQIFVGTLGASNYTFAEATWDQTLPSWIGSHIRMFEYFGGVSRYLVPDNLKSAVTVAGWKRLVLNKTYSDMADHYGTIVEPTRPAHPKDKAKVEKAVQVVERWILFRLRNKVFFGLEELNAEIAKLLKELNSRKTRKLPEGRKKLFEEIEKDKLKPLPQHPYEYAEFRTQMVQVDYTISVDGHAYSVHHSNIGKRVDIRITERMVEILHNGERIASHPRSTIKGGSSISESHMPENHRRIREWTPQRLLDMANFIGTGTVTFVKSLNPSNLSEIGRYKIGTRLVALSEEYTPQRIESACIRALEIHAPGIEQVENILKNNLDQFSANSTEIDDGVNEHENIRGSQYYI